MSAFALESVALLLFILSAGYAAEQACTDGDVRFDEMQPEIVQVCLGNQWGYVCARGFALDRWTRTDNNVFCQQMGLLGSNNDDHSSFKVTSELDGPVNFQTFFCIGTERRLIDCPHDDYATNEHSYCARNITRDNMHMYYYMYATAECSETNVTCTAGSVRIEDNTGLLKICTEGQWHTLCATNITWTPNDAKAVCRELGLNPRGASALLLESTIKERANISFHCTGQEGMLSACTGTIIDCSSVNTVARVKCGVMPQPVSDLNVSMTTHSSVNLSWGPAMLDYNNTIIIDHYSINCTDNHITIIQNIVGSKKESIIHNLQNNHTYTCCVYTVTISDGESKGACINVTTLPLDEIVCTVFETQYVTVGASSAEVLPSSTESAGSSSQSVSPVASWIGGIVIGAVAAVIATLVILLFLKLMQKKMQGRKSSNDNEMHNNNNSDTENAGTWSFSNSASGKVVLNELYDSTSTTMSDNNSYNIIKTQITSEGEQTLYSTVD